MWPRPEREKGPLCAPAKTQLLLSPNWTASPVISSTLLVSALQTPSFNPEQKLLSGLIYNPDLLMGLKAFLPCRAAAGLKQPPCLWASLRLCPLLLARRWHLSGCWPLSTFPVGRTSWQHHPVTSRSGCGRRLAVLKVADLQRGYPQPLSSEQRGSCQLLACQGTEGILSWRSCALG